MSLYVSDFIDGRIDEIMKDLRKTNTEYALAVEKLSQLYENVQPIIESEKEELTISRSDCADFHELLEEELVSSAITQHTLYKQGYLDCVKLLRMLGVLV